MVCRKTGQAQLGGGQEQLAAGALLEHAHAPRARRGRRRKKKKQKKKKKSNDTCRLSQGVRL
jgi:hypothetical protein